MKNSKFSESCEDAESLNLSEQNLGCDLNLSDENSGATLNLNNQNLSSQSSTAIDIASTSNLDSENSATDAAAALNFKNKNSATAGVETALKTAGVVETEAATASETAQNGY